MNTEHNIEAILLYSNEPMSFVELSKILNINIDEVHQAVVSLQEFYKDRGIVLITTSEKICFGTNKNTSHIIEQLQKDELSKEIGRAGLETLSIILYKGPISRKEIDYIRGVNSGFIIRNLLIRGLIERKETQSGERGFSYSATLELLQHLGVTDIKDLPQYTVSKESLDTFAKTAEISEDTETLS